MWINANTLIVYNYVYEIRQAFPDVSFPDIPTEANFESVDVYVVVETEPPEYNKITQNLIESIEYINNQWIQVWSVESATPEEIAQRENAAKQANKQQAESLLQATDWTATVDINNPQYSNPYLGNQSEFLAYRSSVRQIAISPPITVDVWPVKPEEEWISI